jgi:hypothetical protein
MNQIDPDDRTFKIPALLDQLITRSVAQACRRVGSRVGSNVVR